MKEEEEEEEKVEVERVVAMRQILVGAGEQTTEQRIAVVALVAAIALTTTVAETGSVMIVVI
jgi:hypothetical protein